MAVAHLKQNQLNILEEMSTSKRCLKAVPDAEASLVAPPNENAGLALAEVVVVVVVADPKENVEPEVALVVAAVEEAAVEAAPPKLKAGAGFEVSVEGLAQVWSLTHSFSVGFLKSRILLKSVLTTIIQSTFARQLFWMVS